MISKFFPPPPNKERSTHVVVVVMVVGGGGGRGMMASQLARQVLQEVLLQGPRAHGKLWRRVTLTARNFEGA